MDYPLHFTAPTVAHPSVHSTIVDAVTLHGHGSLERVKFQCTALPKDLNEDDVEVEVYECGMSFTDNYLRLGIIRNADFPIIMGSECAGVVKRVGANVTRLQEGQTVLCLKMHGGLFRSTVQLPQANCFPVPKQMKTTEAVALGLNTLTAYVCLFEIGGLKANQSVFMQSIGGGVGTSLIQLARTIPNVKILGTASNFKHEDVLELGADYVFGHDTKYMDKILDVCPDGVDILINSNGGADVDECLQLLKHYGKLILIGSNSTCIYPKTTTWGFIRPVWDMTEIATSQLMDYNVCISGVNIGNFIDAKPQRVSAILAEIFDHFQGGRLKPIFDAVLPVEKVVVAFSLLCSRTNFGKVVLTVRREDAALAGTQPAR